jgi:tetratricopeptide (TPR) repeat protein
MQVIWRSPIHPAGLLTPFLAGSVAIGLAFGGATMAYTRFANQRLLNGLLKDADRNVVAGRYDKAIQNLNRALGLSEDPAPILERRAMAHLRKGQPALAAEDATKAVTLAPNRDLPYRVRAEARLNLQQSAGAVEDLNRALERTPLWAKGLELRAQAHRNQGRYRESLADLNRAIEIEPSSDHYYQRSLTYAAMLDYPQAVLDLNRAIRIERALNERTNRTGLLSKPAAASNSR